MSLESPSSVDRAGRAFLQLGKTLSERKQALESPPKRSFSNFLSEKSGNVKSKMLQMPSSDVNWKSRTFDWERRIRS